MNRIVILDGYTTNPGDLSWDGLAPSGDLEVFDRTLPGEVLERVSFADIVLTNKVPLDSNLLENLPKLRCICVLATGYNNIDVGAAKRFGITVCNVRGYATDSVAQHVFALLLELSNQVGLHHLNVVNGGWSSAPDWSYTLSPTLELAGKTMGIYGFGLIGQKVAEIALAFGMKVISHHKHPERDRRPGVKFVSLEKMFSESDVVTLHAPLTSENHGVANRENLQRMKRTAFLINTGRGGHVHEQDLKWALENDLIAGAALDVLSEEPPRSGNLLIGAKNCIITPHNAWATKEARARLIEETVRNVQAFLAGEPRNVVNGQV